MIVHELYITDYRLLIVTIREPFKNYLADFFPLRGGGYPPFPLRVFGQDDFLLRENSAKKQFFSFAE